MIDVEDYSKNKFVLYVTLSREISLCEPIGLIFGAFTGFMIDFLRQQEILSRPEFSFGSSSNGDEHEKHSLLRKQMSKEQLA